MERHEVIVVRENDEGVFAKDINKYLKMIKDNNYILVDIKFSTCSRYDSNITYSALIIYKR